MGNSSSDTSNISKAELALIEAAKKGESDRIAQIVADGTNVNCRDEKSSTPLMWACAMGHANAVQALINLKANIEDRDNDGYTPLHWAVIQKHTAVVNDLCTKYKADVNAINSDKETALHKASYYNLKDIVSVLIDNGANKNPLDRLYRTPLDRARVAEMRMYLQSLGCKPGKGNKNKGQPGEGEVGPKAEKETAGDMKLDEQEMIRKERMKGEVRKWLSDLSLSEYCDLFLDNGFDRFESVLEMTTEDLKMLGVKIGHIRIIGKSLAQMKEQQAHNDKGAAPAEDQPGGAQAVKPALEPAVEPGQEENGQAEPGVEENPGADAQVNDN